MKHLEGKVALVTGGTRGIGKGIAIGLGEAGATVYVTGRSLNNSSSDVVSGSLSETQSAIDEIGGICIPVQVDHSDDEQVRLLFERIQDEQDGQLDLLVNNAYSGVQAIRNSLGQPFWDCELGIWDASHNVGLRSHYIASVFAARMMTKRNSGLICTISSWAGMSHFFNTAYGVGKAACDRLAADMAVELKPHNVASVSIWPGIVGTELFSSFAAEMNETNTTEQKNSLISDRYNWETPLFTGRVIAALAGESNIMRHTGRVQIVAELASKYGIVDENDVGVRAASRREARRRHRPASLRSLRFVLPTALPILRNYSSLIPDIKIPWSLLLLNALNSPKI
ncbi:MAG: SDR family NAD(P)-dependent oxidoreductase [Nostoc sp. DedVER02]|uniref:SDR family NAD(P)-dependent oxidoreductase n=1 Tax=unclassified Nostoc TaxID=2593658 RepID=UPI002AD2E67B|nr:MULTISPECIES: SDR family NAD(P)-dependent oxidoreductase [unclassified Nostoc]MDZ7986606.1 SDR family NAD(P)-dependent oxidoreductase [Nostoc sp. DedVER02]MDZ8116745.1 SDR family NAD(P)-dependent oxidoreductase [Nostoc sp. DedVER01b]